jgi:hypothetical protein
MNPRVNPQPGQSTPNTRLLEQTSGRGSSVPGKYTLVSPSVRITSDKQKTKQPINNKNQCRPSSAVGISGASG